MYNDDNAEEASGAGDNSTVSMGVKFKGGMRGDEGGGGGAVMGRWMTLPSSEHAQGKQS